MKQNKTIRQENYKKTLTELLDKHPEARMIAKKYKVLAYTLNKEYPVLMSKNESWDNFLRDVVYIDRVIRKLTEGDDQYNKDIAEQEWQMGNRYESGYNQKLNYENKL